MTAGLQTIRRDGLTFNVGTDYDGDEFWRTYYETGWEREQAWVLDQIPDRGLFIDIGAWIGPWTLPALARGHNVHAYEPDPVAYERLTANLAANRFDAHVATFERGVTARAAAVTLKAQGNIWGGSNSGRWAEMLDAPQHTVTVPAVPIDIVLDQPAPMFVKVDVEGDELDLFPPIADRGLPCHISLHAPLARRAGDPVDFRAALEPSFRKYGRLIVDGRRTVKASQVPYDTLCSITCTEPR